MFACRVSCGLNLLLRWLVFTLTYLSSFRGFSHCLRSTTPYTVPSRPNQLKQLRKSNRAMGCECLNRLSGNEDDTHDAYDTRHKWPVQHPPTHPDTHPDWACTARPLSPLEHESGHLRSAFSPCVFCRTPRRAAEQAEAAASAVAHDEEQERARARARTKGHEDDDHHDTRRGRGRGRRRRGLGRGRWRRRRGRRRGRQGRRRAGPRTPVRAIASRDESRGARPRATNQQLVGIGQGGCTLPSGKEGVCDVGRNVWVGRRAGVAHPEE